MRVAFGVPSPSNLSTVCFSAALLLRARDGRAHLGNATMTRTWRLFAEPRSEGETWTWLSAKSSGGGRGKVGGPRFRQGSLGLHGHWRSEHFNKTYPTCFVLLGRARRVMSEMRSAEKLGDEGRGWSERNPRGSKPRC